MYNPFDTETIIISAGITNFMVSLVFLFGRLAGGMGLEGALLRFFIAWPLGTIMSILFLLAIRKLITR